MGRYKIKWMISGCALVFLSSAWLLFFYYMPETFDQIAISPDSGVYGEGVQISAQAFPGNTVYYAIDGLEPSENWDNVKVYTEPLALHSDPDGRTQQRG